MRFEHFILKSCNKDVACYICSVKSRVIFEKHFVTRWFGRNVVKREEFSADWVGRQNLKEFLYQANQYDRDFILLNLSVFGPLIEPPDFTIMAGYANSIIKNYDFVLPEE